MAATVALRAALSFPLGRSIEPETSTMITSARCCGTGTTAPPPPPAAGHLDDGVDLGATAPEVLVLIGLRVERRHASSPMSRGGHDVGDGDGHVVVPTEGHGVADQGPRHR